MKVTGFYMGEGKNEFDAAIKMEKEWEETIGKEIRETYDKVFFNVYEGVRTPEFDDGNLCEKNKAYDLHFKLSLPKIDIDEDSEEFIMLEKMMFSGLNKVDDDYRSEEYLMEGYKMGESKLLSEEKVMRRLVDSIRSVKMNEIIEEFMPLMRSESSYFGYCPFHQGGGELGSFIVDPENGVYRCFSCGSSGDVFAFVGNHLGLSFKDTVIFLGNKLDLITPEEREAYFTFSCKRKPSP